MEKFKIEAKVAKKDKSLEKIISSCGIEYPHESLAFFSAIYAKFDEPNKNKVELASSVKKQVPQLRGTQVNINHYRRNWIVGTILDAWTEKDEIKIAFSFYKSVYPDIYAQALELLENGDLSVSFELTVEKADIEKKSGGIRRLKKVNFDGVGFLLGETPACPEAIVYEQANINSLREKDLVFANKLKDVIKEEEKKVDKKANDALLAKQKEMVIEEFGNDAVKDWSDEDFLNDEKINSLRDSIKAKSEQEEVVEENKEEISKEEEVSEDEMANFECECIECGKKISSEEHCKDLKCPECGGQMRRENRPGPGQSKEETAEKHKMEEETKSKRTIEIDDETMEETQKVESETVTKVDDEIKQVRKQLDEVLFKANELEKKVSEQEAIIAEKDKKIQFLSEHAKTIVALRNELGDYIKDFSDEELFDTLKIENARLRKENDELKGKKIETASEEKTEETSEKEETKKEPEVKETAEKTEDKVEEKDIEDSSNKDANEDLDTGHEEPETINRDEAIRDYIRNRSKHL